MKSESSLYPTNRVELRTKRGIRDYKMIIELPFDLTEKEAKRVKDYLDTMVAKPLQPQSSKQDTSK